MVVEGGTYLEDELLIPYYHVTQVSSKTLRKRIADAFNHWLQIPDNKMAEIMSIMDVYQDSLTLAEDIKDGNEKRKGLPSAQCVYGVPWTMNTAFLVFYKALERCTSFHPQGTLIFTEQSLELCRGQGKEIYWRDNFVCPTEDEYREALQQKTTGMLFLAVRLMQALSDNKTNYIEFGKSMGYYLQIRDHYCNIMIPKVLEGSPGQISSDEFYTDLTDGKFTLPIIHAVNNSNAMKRAAILNILKQRTKDIALKRHCVALLEEIGSLQYTRKILVDLDQQLRQQIKRMGGNPLMTSILDDLLSWNSLNRK